MARQSVEVDIKEDSAVDRAELNVRVEYLEEGQDRIERKFDGLMGSIYDFKKEFENTAADFKELVMGKISEVGRLVQSLEFRVASLEKDRDSKTRSKTDVVNLVLNVVLTGLVAILLAKVFHVGG